MTLATLCDRAITLWEKASGTSLQEAAGIFSMDPCWNPKHVSRRLSQLRNAPHGEQLCLNTLSANYPSLSEYLQGASNTSSLMWHAHEQLGHVLAAPETQAFLLGAKTLLRELLHRFRAELTPEDLVYVDSLPLHVLQDADQCFVTMKKMQLSSTTVCHPGETLYYNNAIPLFDDVRSLMNAVQAMPNGWTLNAILEDHPADSYFALCFKSGGHNLLLTDLPNYADPQMSDRLSRRNQRHNAARVQQSYLPYHLLNLQWEQNDKQCSVTQVLPAGALNASQSHRVLGFIADLPVDTLLWLSRLADLCVTADLGGVSTVHQVALLPDSAHAHTAEDTSYPVVPPQHVNMSMITLPELDSITRTAFATAYPEAGARGGTRQWMEKAYAKDIPMDALYPSEHNMLRALPAPSTSTQASAGGAFSILRHPMPVTLLPLPSKKIYTAEDAHRAALYIGRHNQAAVVEARALQDFVARRDKVIAWVYRRIVDNLPALLPALVTLDHDAFSMHQHPGACRMLAKTELVRQVHWVKCTHRWINSPSDASTLIRIAKLRVGHEACCYLQKHFDHQDVHSDHRFILNISNIFDLMNVTGLPRDQFPDCLQHYGIPQHLGNTVLSTVDPMDLLLDPWNSLVFTFALPVSRAAVNRHRKSLGLAAIARASAVPHYWQDTPEADALYSSLREAGHSPVKVGRAPSYIHHESSDQPQCAVDALNNQRRMVYELSQHLKSIVHQLQKLPLPS